MSKVRGAWRGLCLLVPTYLLVTYLLTHLPTYAKGAWSLAWAMPITSSSLTYTYPYLLTYLPTNYLRPRCVEPGVGYAYHLAYLLTYN